MDIDQTDITDEEKFEEYFALENNSNLEVEDKFDMYDQYFTTPTEAKAYNDWRKAKQAREPNAPGDDAAASDAESKHDDPHPLEVYQDPSQNVDFKNVNQVAMYVFCGVDLLSR